MSGRNLVVSIIKINSQFRFLLLMVFLATSRGAEGVVGRVAVDTFVHGWVQRIWEINP